MINHYGTVTKVTRALLKERGYVSQPTCSTSLWNHPDRPDVLISQDFFPDAIDGAIVICWGGINGPRIRYLHELIAHENK